MDVGRPKRHDFPPYMTVDGDRGGFIVRNPLTGKKRRFTDEAEAREVALALAEWVEQERQARLLDAGRPTIASLVDAWERDRLQFMPWDEGTRENMLAKMRRIRRELGPRVLVRTDCMFLEDWLSSFSRTADQFNKWRYALVLLWRYGLSRNLVASNEPEKIEPRSTSKKLPMNRKRRRPLDVEGFWQIHEKAPPWLQLAMELSLVTLQGRSEVCNMRHPDFRDGYLYVIREKTSADSDMAFIKIRLTEQLEELRRRALALDGIASPYLVHRAPAKRRREWIEGKPHWTYVEPRYLTRAFEAARDQVERYAALPPGERPTFHEIRGLGSRIYEAQGMPREAIQALMTHAHRRTTQIYLEKGRAGLTDEDFIAVSAPLRLADLKV